MGLFVESSGLSPLNKYLLVRDVTFFVVDFYTGDRASDLGRLEADQLFRLRDREGFLFDFTFSETRRAGQLRPFLLCYAFQMYPSARFFFGLTIISQLAGRWVSLFSVNMSLDLRNIRSLYPIARLEGRLYLHDFTSILGPRVSIDGETPHSFRVGLSYTLQGLGCTPVQIAQYVGWRSTEMALYYTRHSNVSASLQLLERVTFSPCFKGLSACSAPL